MTKQKAIKILERDCPKRPQKLWSVKRTEAIHMAIEALSDSNKQKQDDSLLRVNVDSVSNKDVIYRQQAITSAKAIFDNSWMSPEKKEKYALEMLEELPSAQGDAEFINWLLDEVWDEEMWELNYRAFPELLCRRFVKAGWLKEEGGKYVRLDKQTSGD